MNEVTNGKIQRDNEKVLELLSIYLNFFPDRIDQETVEAITEGINDSADYAYSALMAAACGLDPYGNQRDKELFRGYFLPMIKKQSVKEYADNAYYRNICIPDKVYGKWELCNQSYAPYEAFVYDDLEIRANGRILPHIGYFNQRFQYPCVKENGREWMTVTPNEINTMKKAVTHACGNALTFGLGLGYYAYMVSQKKDVERITIVERDREVIQLFSEIILPQFSNRQKINIVCADAFDFADRELPKGVYDHIFTDIWHDSSDGMELYLKMREREHLSPNARFDYWIEKTIKCYLGEK